MFREQNNVNLKHYNSFGVESSASRVIFFDSDNDLAELCRNRSDVLSGEWSVLGGGNNILFIDNYEGTLLHPVCEKIEIIGSSGSQVNVKVDAGVDWDRFVEWTVENGLWGVENLSLIPGQVGAAPVQNIGAYGVEAKDAIQAVHMFVPESRNTFTMANEFCAFGYRDSVFKHDLKGRVIITSVTFSLSRIPSPKLDYGAVRNEVEKLGDVSIENIRKAIIDIRRSKLPDPKITGNAGSFFKNPVVSKDVADKIRNEYPDMPSYIVNEDSIKIPAGWLIEKSGWKGRSKGRVGVHERQALVLINNGGANGREVIELAKEIMKDIRNKFGVEITPEVNILPCY